MTEAISVATYLAGGVPLYRWQQRLLDEWFALGRAPDAVDVPTGLGKTKTITAWLVARMEGAALPRRLVYVVDRRTVVDQATNEADGLAKRLRRVLDGSEGGYSVEQRNRWRRNLGLLGDEMPISTLRGQHLDNRKWMDDPSGSAIVIGTVDMVGSRLLFSGYGVSRGMRPAHAGLIGCDTLLVLDEAHLVPPFEDLLRQVAAARDVERERSESVVPPFRLMTLSATGRASDAKRNVFSLDAADCAEPAVQARLTATKRVRLLPGVEKTTDLIEALATRAWDLAEGARRVLVYSNSRRVAQAVEEKLRARVAREIGKDAKRTELLVGERRFRERTLATAEAESDESSVLRRFDPAAKEVREAVFLVATSAGEVGIDLDADDVVCDLVAWDRMAQRFGRVNRRACPGVSRIDVIPALAEKDAEDEIERERLTELRAPFDSDVWLRDDDGTRDASPLALMRLREAIPDLIRTASSPRPFYPLLEAPIVDAWAMTTLRTHPGRPNVGPWLRGWVDDVPQSTLVWRIHVPLRPEYRDDDGSIRTELQTFFEAAPPHVTETLEAPTARVAELLKKRCDAWIASKRDAKVLEPWIVILDGSNDLVQVESASSVAGMRKVRNFERVIAGCTVVVDARLGGLDASGLLDGNASEPPVTLDGDAATWKLRLETYGRRRIGFGAYPASRRKDNWRPQGFHWRVEPDNPDSQTLWVDVFRGRDGSEFGDPAIAQRAQGLAEHHAWTRDEAERIARALGMSDRLVTLVSAAAAFHDAGKARELWQNAMNAARDDGRPYAKTVGGATPRALANYRHEFGSVADAHRDRALVSLDDDARDLALHLIAAHHGHARPTIYPYDPDAAPTVSRELARTIAERYARQQALWGPWGLAWLESVLRAADWSASRKVNSDG